MPYTFPLPARRSLPLPHSDMGGWLVWETPSNLHACGLLLEFNQGETWEIKRSEVKRFVSTAVPCRVVSSWPYPSTRGHCLHQGAFSHDFILAGSSNCAPCPFGARNGSSSATANHRLIAQASYYFVNSSLVINPP